jgi:CheY-like chemotaxis protein
VFTGLARLARTPEQLIDHVAMSLHAPVERLSDAAKAMIAHSRHADAVLTGLTAVVIDDDIRNIFSLASALEEYGIELRYAESGRAGLELLDSLPAVDMVLVDIMMPDMDGYETMREIRSRARFADLPVVAVTAKAMKGDRQKCIQAGASDYVSKPVDIDQLISVLRVSVQRADAQRLAGDNIVAIHSAAQRNDVDARGPASGRFAARGPTRARILIVDDDERNAFAAIQALETLGQELVVARSGEEALRRLLTDDFAVILLDLHMPGMDGYETAELIRQRRRNRDVPIVFLTAVFRDEAHIFKAYSAGAVDVVFKPVDPFILRSKVQVLVDLHIKTLELEQQSESRRVLIEENARIHAEKLAAERSLRSPRSARRRSCAPCRWSSTRAPPIRPTSRCSSATTSSRLTGFRPRTSWPRPIRHQPGPSRRRRHRRARPGRGPQTGAYSLRISLAMCADGTYKSLIDQGVLARTRRAAAGGVRHAAGQHRAPRAGRATGPRPQDGGGRPADRRRRPRLQQPADRGPGQYRADQAAHRRADELSRQIDAVRQAAEKGGALTRQLLAFSRRQRLNPLTVDLNDLIADFAPLLRQAVGEAVSIELSLAPSRCRPTSTPPSSKAPC